jgi:hypothetical protein
VRRLAALCLVLAAGCGEDSNPVPAACLESAAAVREAATRGALRDGTLISACVERADAEGEVLDLGTDLVRAAERLASDESARELGFLVGAVRRGAARTEGVGAEVARRVEAAARPVAADPRLRDDLERGLRDGQARG